MSVEAGGGERALTQQVGCKPRCAGADGLPRRRSSRGAQSSRALLCERPPGRLSV